MKIHLQYRKPVMMPSYPLARRQTLLVRAVIPLLVSLVLPITAFGQGGNFSAGVNYPVPGQGGIAAGDFNGDKVPDIVIANQDSTVNILIGIPGGTFQPQYTVQAVPSTGTYSTYMTESVAVGDFNGDGNLDLAVLSVTTDSSQGTVNILLGDGTGHFAPPMAIPLDGTQPLQIVSADFNNDSKMDLAVLNLGSMSVTILLGKGNGTFSVLVDTTFGSQPAPGTNGNMAVADLNKDGKLDLAIAGTSPSNGDGVVSVLLGNGDGTFQPAANWIVTSTGGCTESCAPPTNVAVGDFNGDGNLDLAVDDGTVGGLFVLLGKGDGSFQSPPIHSGGAAFGGSGNSRDFLVTGDFNGDGKLDLAEAEGGVYPSFPDLTIALGNGDGTFAAGLQMSVGTALSFSSATAIITDDLNADGFPDLILATNTGYAIGLGFNAATVVLNCGLRCTNTAVASSPASSVFNQTVTFTATVTAANAKATGTPTGTVTF
jgi:hypothetical protein